MFTLKRRTMWFSWPIANMLRVTPATCFKSLGKKGDVWKNTCSPVTGERMVNGWSIHTHYNTKLGQGSQKPGPEHSGCVHFYCALYYLIHSVPKLCSRPNARTQKAHFDLPRIILCCKNKCLLLLQKSIKSQIVALGPLVSSFFCDSHTCCYLLVKDVIA